MVERQNEVIMSAVPRFVDQMRFEVVSPVTNQHSVMFINNERPLHAELADFNDFEGSGRGKSALYYFQNTVPRCVGTFQITIT